MESFFGFLLFILVLMALMVTRTPVAVALGTIGILGTAFSSLRRRSGSSATSPSPSRAISCWSSFRCSY